MNKYYLNNKSLSSGHFSVHKEDCPFLPESNKRIYLGAFSSCREAVNIAKIISTKSDACLFCIKECSKASNIKLHDWRVPESLRYVYSEN